MNPEEFNLSEAGEITENSDAEFIESVFEDLNIGYQDEAVEIVGDNLNLDGVGELGVMGLTLLGVGYGLKVMFKGLESDKAKHK
ncbi:hypothetical protein KAS31_00125 [Candidatus Parcubacteria bacterium]|nr:hypothetical protein [Candidatus Parcubacteria bacterium]